MSLVKKPAVGVGGGGGGGQLKMAPRRFTSYIQKIKLGSKRKWTDQTANSNMIHQIVIHTCTFIRALSSRPRNTRI